MGVNQGSRYSHLGGHVETSKICLTKSHSYTMNSINTNLYVSYLGQLFLNILLLVSSEAVHKELTDITWKAQTLASPSKILGCGWKLGNEVILIELFLQRIFNPKELKFRIYRVIHSHISLLHCHCGRSYKKHGASFELWLTELKTRT